MLSCARVVFTVPGPANIAATEALVISGTEIRWRFIADLLWLRDKKFGRPVFCCSLPGMALLSLRLGGVKGLLYSGRAKTVIFRFPPMTL